MMDRISICKALAKRNEIDPFLIRMVAGDANGTHTTILCENDRGQITRETLNSSIYSQQLDRLKLVTDQKRPELANRRDVVFHQDNTTPHTFIVTHQKLWELSWKVLMHPPYSPDLEPNDYHLLLSSQKFQSDKKLGSREDCRNRLLEIFANKGQDFY
ncbi:transposase [Trichonephila clavipes]|nr:transposase [Trichonephila clavipes]